ncbi:hypothetical protein BCEN4_740031 [Burkholderia cenocepacia]|nr:hypothetical protein BCEN4_740031 [Burkholderia cenocepacia]
MFNKIFCNVSISMTASGSKSRLTICMYISPIFTQKLHHFLT